MRLAWLRARLPRRRRHLSSEVVRLNPSSSSRTSGSQGFSSWVRILATVGRRLFSSHCPATDHEQAFPSSQPHGTVHTPIHKTGVVTERYTSNLKKTRLAWSGLVWRLISAPTPLVPVQCQCLCLCAMPCPSPVQAFSQESALTGWKYDSAAPLNQSEPSYTQWAGAAVPEARLLWDLYRPTWRECEALQMRRGSRGLCVSVCA